MECELVEANITPVLTPKQSQDFEDQLIELEKFF